jgi:hypothetical protein
MGQAGRVTVTVSFTLDPQADRDILRWLGRFPKRAKSAAIRDALREHVVKDGVTIGDVYQAVKELDRTLRVAAGVVRVGATPSSEGQDWPDEDPDAAAALDALGKL